MHLTLSTAWLALGCALLALACGDEDVDTYGGGMSSCAEPHDAHLPSDVRARYDYDVDELLTRGLGRWEGQYPGGDVLDAFDVVIDARPAPVGSAELHVGFALPAGGGETQAELDARNARCAGTFVTAEMTATFSPAFEPALASDPPIAETDLLGLAVMGYTLESGDPTDVYASPGQVYTEQELHLKAGAEHGAGGGETNLFFVFTDAEELWIAVVADGSSAIRFERSGHRVAPSAAATDDPDGGTD